MESKINLTAKFAKVIAKFAKITCVYYDVSEFSHQN